MTDDPIKKTEAIIRRYMPHARGREGELDRGLSLLEDLKGHPLDVLQVVMDIEDGLDIEITDEEDEALITVGDVYDLVASKLGVGA